MSTLLNAEKTHCPAGHAYDETNTHWTPQGHRRCRACHRASAERRRRAAGLEIRGQATHCRNGLHEMTADNVLVWKGKQRQCRACRKINTLLRFYNLSQQYAALVERQEGRCAGCDEHVGNDALYVDHDHACCPGDRSCGKCVRGLVCSPCNLALGHVKDRVDVLLGLVRYLERAA